MEKGKMQFENESEGFLESKTKRLPSAFDLITQGAIALQKQVKELKTENASLKNEMFDELCKIKDALDKSNVEIMKSRRSLDLIDIHNLSKEKRNWIYHDLKAIDFHTKKISELCGTIEFLKINLRKI
jgi:predicted nuclease with TOPRIM domain